MPLREMKTLLDAGFTPMEVIEAGTRLAARVCGQEKELRAASRRRSQGKAVSPSP